MKIKVTVIFAVILLAWSGGAYAANGNMTVSGTVSAQTVSVGTGGVKFSDGSVQTNASRLVWDHTVTGGGVYSVSTADDGVVLDEDGGYEFEFIIFTFATGTYSIYVNNNRNTINYARSKNFGAMVNDAVFWDPMYSGCVGRTTGSILVEPVNHYVTVFAFNSLSGNGTIPASYFAINSWVGYPLTRIDIVSSGGINTNSRFRLWKKK